MRRAGPTDSAARGEEAFRGFVAVLLPDTLRDEVARVAAPLRAVTGVKWVAPENYHLTLKFLGQVPRSIVEALCVSLQEAAAAVDPFRIEIAGFGAFPKPARPQTVWAGVTAGQETLDVLARAVEAACRRHGFDREERPFHAHLTLGRVQTPVGRDALAARLRESSAAPIGAFEAEAMCLMRSTLTPRGAIYSVEETFRLGTGDSHLGTCRG